MDSESRNLQNDFFNAARKEKATVTVYRCHSIKEPPCYRCGHPLQVAQSMIEMKPQ